MSTPPASPDPRGSTLWEMFLQWMKNRRSSEPVTSSSLANPLDWTPGAPVSLNATQGPEFASALTRVDELRHVIRREGGQEFHFVDYVLRVSPRDADPVNIRIRCLPDGGGGWHRLLLRQHDEFGFAADFLEVLNDPSGVFTVEDEASEAGDPPVEISFQRLNEVTGPWHATVIHQRGPEADSTAPPAASQAADQDSGTMEYWDFLHVHGDGTEEFLFTELDGSTGWIQIWRGSRVFL
ncbi:MAG: hypothetical protein V4726_05215 [Verrucomicrobiota bacterium]